MSKALNLSSFDEENQKKIKEAIASGKQIVVEYEEDSSDYDDYDLISEFPTDWISDYCDSENIECLVYITKKFFREESNYSDLSKIVPNYETAIKILRNQCNKEIPFDEELDMCVLQLYCLIHQRFILTKRGMDDMFDNFMEGLYGQCPRIGCNGQKVLPYGVSNEFGVGHLMVFCPCCKDVYFPRDPILKKIDGSAFGTNFVPAFIKQFHKRMGLKPCRNYQFTVDGFKLSEKKRRVNREQFNNEIEMD